MLVPDWAGGSGSEASCVCLFPATAQRHVFEQNLWLKCWSEPPSACWVISICSATLSGMDGWMCPTLKTVVENKGDTCSGAV